MTASRNNFVWLVAGTLALIVQSAISALTHHFAHIGGEGPDFWGGVLLITELPGAVVGEQLFGSTSPACLVLGVLSGAVELFIVFALLIFGWRFLDKQHDAIHSPEPSAVDADNSAARSTPQVGGGSGRDR
jgi:uncharacterized membrane protein